MGSAWEVITLSVLSSRQSKRLSQFYLPTACSSEGRFAPTKHRARMMATVFFMQPLGQVSGNIVSLIAVAASKSQGDEDLIRMVDIMWRWVIGVGVVPGVIALLFRLAIPETPRFLLDIEDNPVKAEFDATHLWGESATSTGLEDGSRQGTVQVSSPSEAGRSVDEDVITTTATEWTNVDDPPTTLNSNWTLSKADILQYFWTEGNWRTLAGTALAWLLLDFGFYGIGLSSPQFLAKTWGTLNISGPTPPWKTDDNPDVSIYDMFYNGSLHAMVILNSGSLAGGLLMILFASHLNRVSLQKYGFLALAALFIALGTMFITTSRQGAVAIALYITGQLLFNFGTLNPIHPSLPPFPLLFDPADCRNFCSFLFPPRTDTPTDSNNNNMSQDQMQPPTSSPPKSSQPATAPPATASAQEPASSAPSSRKSSPHTTNLARLHPASRKHDAMEPF